jgi:histidinol-phosphate/aromatic aminotransferase/cobyric acid decarboxylase-like protein
MQAVGSVTSDRLEQLVGNLSHKLQVRPEMVLPFAGFDEIMPKLFAVCRSYQEKLLVAGHLSPEVAIAADKCSLKPLEIFGSTPFGSCTNAVLAAVDRPDRIIYVANPNRISGANLGLKDLDRLAEAVPHGMLIVDEHYFDFYGISAAPLLAERTNVAILRSFTASFGITSADSGYVVAPAEIIEHLRAEPDMREISTIVYRTMMTTQDNESLLAKRLTELHDESLRLATALTRLGFQARITSADFLLLRVADPTSVGNFLARYRIPIENLDGYPHLQKYMRYRIQSHLSNDGFLEACSKMPAEYFKLATAEHRPITLRKPVQEMATPPALEEVLAGPEYRRISVLEAVTGRK